MPKKTTKALAAMRAAVSQPGSSSTASAAGLMPSENASVMTPSATVIPVEPIMRSRRRPIRSMSAMASSVTTMFVTEVMTEMVSASDSSNPTDFHSVVE